jgi:hypothetical protein
MDFMSGFGPWTHRLECLKAGLVFALHKMHSSNPLGAARSIYMVSTSSHFILQDCFKSNYASNFRQEKNQNPKLTWITWKNHQLESLRQLASASSATIAYYSPPVNTDRSSPIFLLDWKSFDLALNWRSNNMFLHRMCSCSQSFNRAHLSCFLTGNSIFDAHLAHRSFTTASQRVSAASRDRGASRQLTLLDHLLNRREHEDFLNLLQILTSALDSAHSDISALSLVSPQTQLP